MSSSPPSRQPTSRMGLLPALGVALTLALVVIGVVMADTHVPIPIAPDAKPADGAQVATFALG